MGGRLKQKDRMLILQQVKYIIFKHLPSSAKVYLIGSWAREEEKQSSDIDIAIRFERNDPQNHRTLTQIRDALEESTVAYRVDIVHLNAADDFIVRKVEEEGILWDE